MNPLTRTQRIVSWICRIVAAVILLQTLFFKFTAAPESVYIFSKLGVEPWGRIGTGTAELIASILFFLPGCTWLGALLALGLMGGAIMSHLFVLGISVQNDGGELFTLALTVATCSAVVLFIHRGAIPWVGPILARRSSMPAK